MIVIGIDQSYTGFGYCTDGVSKKKGFPLSKYQNEVHRLFEIREWFRDWLQDQLSDNMIDLIVMEGYANAAKFGREAAGELGGQVKTVIWEEWGGAPLIVPPTSLKKFVTGSGAAKKNTMLMGVYKQWGVEFSDDNQADAYALEQFGRGYIEPEGLHKYQIEAVEAVRKKA